MTEESEEPEELRNFPQGRAIKHLRAFLGKNQDEIAALAGVSKAAVSLWEREKVSSIQYDTIKRLVEAVGLSMDDFNQFTETNDERYIASARWPEKDETPPPRIDWARNVPGLGAAMSLAVRAQHAHKGRYIAALSAGMSPTARRVPMSVAHLVDKMDAQDAQVTDGFRTSEDPSADHLRRLMQSVRIAINDAASISSRFDAVFSRGYLSLLVSLAGLNSSDTVPVSGKMMKHWHVVDIPHAPCDIFLTGAANADAAREAQVKAFAQPLGAPALVGPVFLRARHNGRIDNLVVIDLTTRTPASLAGFAYHLFAETLRIGRHLLTDVPVQVVVVAPAIAEFVARRIAVRGSGRYTPDAAKMTADMRAELDAVLSDGMDLVSHFGWSTVVVDDLVGLIALLSEKLDVDIPPTAMQAADIESGAAPFDENDPAWGKSW